MFDVLKDVGCRRHLALDQVLARMRLAPSNRRLDFRLLPIFKSLLGVVPFIMAEILNGVFLYINLRLAIDPVKSSLARELLDCVCTLIPDTFIQL